MKKKIEQSQRQHAATTLGFVSHIFCYTRWRNAAGGAKQTSERKRREKQPKKKRVVVRRRKFPIFCWNTTRGEHARTTLHGSKGKIEIHVCTARVVRELFLESSKIYKFKLSENCTQLDVGSSDK